MVRSGIFIILVWLSGYQQDPGNRADKLYLLGKFDPSADGRFVKPDDRYTAGAARSQYLRKETYEAFVKMAQAAEKTE